MYDLYCSFVVFSCVYTRCAHVFTISAIGDSVSVMNTLADWGLV